MAQDEQLNVHDIVWNFSVTDPRLHSKGFTVYKVSCKCFSLKCPELLTELVCWKRYNDFKLLFKSLTVLHKAQQGSHPFPEFVKPTIFGRFTESVIEKRRQGAVELLNFISTQPHLYKSHVFKHFLEEGRVQSDFNKRGSLLVSRSSKQNVISGQLKVDADVKDHITPTHLLLDNHEEVKPRPDNQLTASLGSETNGQTPQLMQDSEAPGQVKIEQTILEGTWNFPQVADDVSLGSSTEDEIVDVDDDFVSTSSLPDADLTSFNTRSPSFTKTVMGKSTPGNASWLQEGLNICAVMGSETSSCYTQGGLVQELPGRSMILESSNNNRAPVIDAELAVTAAVFSALDSNQLDPGAATRSKSDAVGKSIVPEECESVKETCQSSGSSKTECGKGDLDLSVELHMRTSSCGSDATTSSWGSQDVAFTQTRDLSNTLRSSFDTSGSFDVESDFWDSSKILGQKSTQAQTSRSLLKSLVSGKSVLKRPRSVTEQSVSTMSLGGKDDYIYRAANQISKAQNSEANANYEVAFAYYKSGVGILLHGVQGDTNKYRRDAVRRKTAKYLMKAEDLYNRHLADDNMGELRWGTDSFLSPSLDPSFAFIRGSAKELRNFQVLGTIDKVILVRHKVTDETFVIKSIPKSTLDTGSTQSILPTSCPYMVSLHRFFETEESVFLLLQYASGGKLWTYIGDYLYSEKNTRANWDGGKADKEDFRCVCLENKWEETNSNENFEQESSYLKDVITNGETSNVDRSKECGLQAQLLTCYDIPRFPKLNTEMGNLDATVQSASKSSHSGSFSYGGGEVNHGLGGEGILTDSNSTEMPASSRKTSSTLEAFSSLSDKCASVGEQDSSVISPASLPDDEIFHSLLQNDLATSEAFSTTAADGNDDTHHCVSFSEKVNDIFSVPEHCTSPEQMSSHQISSHRTFNLPGNEEDIIRKSKELIVDVNKVIEETNRTAFSPSQVQPLCQTLVHNTEECMQYDNDRKSSMGNISKHGDQQYDSTLSGKLYDGEDQNNLSPAEFVNAEDINVNYLRNTSLSLSVDAATPVLTTFSEQKRKQHSQSFTGSSGSLFKQTSTPQRLSISHSSCKGVGRSASFESDNLRSSLRNRARAVSDSFEQVDRSSVDTVQIPESLIKKWIAQMVTAVSRLHSLGVVCRDLKPSNVLLGDGGQVYLTYFCNLGHGDQEFDWAAKENLYAAPEVGSVNKYDGSCDWWSIGALLYELVIGRSLSKCHPGGINSHTCLHIPAFVSSETRALLEGLLCHNPNERLGSGMAGSDEIKAHPFFAGVDWHSLQYS
ncbi:hypothetical protein BsWGS_14870 [Bradybaena similaris]